MNVLIIGGCTEGEEKGCLRSVEVINLDGIKNGDTSSALIDNVLVQPRRGGCLFKNNQEVIIAGGCSGPKIHLDSCELITFDNGTLKSELIAYKIDETSCSAYCQINDTLLIVGGFDGFDCLNSCSLNDFSKSEPIKFRFISRLKNSAAVIDPWNQDLILLIGGWDETRTLNAIFSFNLSEKTSEVSRLLPYPIEGHSVNSITLEVDSVIFVVGGFNGVNVIDTIILMDKYKCNVLDVKLDEARENHSGLYIELLKELWIIGGWNGKNALDTVERFKVHNQKPYLEKISNFKLKSKRQKCAAVCI